MPISPKEVTPERLRELNINRCIEQLDEKILKLGLKNNGKIEIDESFFNKFDIYSESTIEYILDLYSKFGWRIRAIDKNGIREQWRVYSFKEEK